MTFRGVLGALALLLAAALPAAAQNVQTTGDIRGRTLDQAGEPVPGVVVTARSTETGLERGVITADNGIYVLRLLPPSTYTVTAEAIGYATQTIENVRVAIGQSAAVNFTLAAEAIEIDALVITGERAPIDVADASVTELVTVEQIENLPALGRDFTDFIALSPQVAVDPGVTTGGQFSIGGQSASQTNLQIDGVDANNAFFGENRGGARIPFVFSLESIEEFQIITNGYDVEYGAYSGGIVNVVTRSGTNEFEGTVYGNFRSDALTGRGFLDEPVADYSVQQFAGRVSGPIVRDNAFFLVSGDVQRRREPQLPVTLGRYDDDPVAQAELQRFWQILEDVYGVDSPATGYESFSTTNDVLSLFGRVDWNLNDAHRLSVRHNFTTYTNDNEFDPDFDDYYGQSRSETLEDDSHSFVTELSSVFDQNTFNVFRFQYATEERPRMGSELRPALITTLSNGDLIGYGGTFVAFHNNLEESKYQLINNFTRVFDEHTVKIGAQGLFTNAVNDFLPALSGSCGRGSQGAGIFCFDDLDALEAGIASSYQFNVQQGGATVPRSEVGLSELAFYIQDEWSVTPKLTVTAGLRHDRQWFDDNPGRVLDVERS
ncbi:MAG TPA: TonB-dependent receptor, partial [Longimicrobiales bacterium]